MKKIFVILVYLYSVSAWTFYDENYVNQVKQSLQQDLKQNYLPLLIDQFGTCDDNPLNCLSQNEDIVRLKTKDKNICFPYTECGFYKCMEDKYRCHDVGYEYFKKLAYPTCSAYVKNIRGGEFSKKGIEWVYTVMTCLQKGLVDECDRDDHCSQEPAQRKRVCDHITEFTLDYHPGCYINSGVGVCRLPMRDKLKIWKTVSPFLTKRERQEAYRVVFYCMTGKK